MKPEKIAALLVSAFLLAGCAGRSGGKEFTPAETSLFLTKEGTVTSAVVEDFDKDYYSRDELEDFVEEALVSFNGPNGGKAAGQEESRAFASLKECSADQNRARVVIEFSDASQYLRFEEQYPSREGGLSRLDIVSVPEGITRGYLVGANFKTPSGKTVSYDEITKQSKLFVAYVEGEALIQTEGSLKYVSEGVAIQDGMALTPGSEVSYLVFQ